MTAAAAATLTESDILGTSRVLSSGSFVQHRQDVWVINVQVAHMSRVTLEGFLCEWLVEKAFIMLVIELLAARIL